MVINKGFLVEKTNILNEIRSSSMTLQELRFFSIYLSKINSRDKDTRCVRFLVADFFKIMDLDNVRIDYLKNVTSSLLSKVVNVPRESGGYTAFQLFKECTVDVDESGEWYIEIDAHDKALPLMFDFKNKYFTYRLWNALRLKSSNQLRMYEILKQYEKKGERVIAVDELKALLGISAEEYPRFNNFKARVIDVCQQALKENTDIKFTCEPYGKLGKGGKISKLRFIISKNSEHIDPLSLDDFIQQQEVSPDETIDSEQEVPCFENKILADLAESCDFEFTELEMQVLYDLVIKAKPYKSGQNNLNEWYDFLKLKHDELKLKASRNNVSSRFGYIKKLLELELS